MFHESIFFPFRKNGKVPFKEIRSILFSTMPQCMGLKTDGDRCERQANNDVEPNARHLHYCGTHWGVYNRHVGVRRPLTVVVADQHHRVGKCHRWIQNHWCTRDAEPNSLICEHHRIHHEQGERMRDARRELARQVEDLHVWYTAQQMTWRQMMDHLFTHHANLPRNVLNGVSFRYFNHPAVIEPEFTHIRQFHIYVHWNLGGRQGQPPDLTLPPPPPRPTGLAVIAMDRQNVHTRPVVEQSNKNLKKLLEEQEKLGKPMRAPEWFAAKWLVRSYGTWRVVTSTVNDMMTWYNTANCKIHNDWLYRRALDGLYLKLQSLDNNDMRAELYKRTFEECYESIGMCCEGHISRLCNVLVGFDDTFAPPIPFGEILQSKMAAISVMEIPTDEKVRQAIEFFNEFAVPEAERSAWLEAF